MQIRPVRRLEMDLGVELLGTKITGIVSANAAERARRLGNELPFAPRMTLTGSIRYALPLANGMMLTPSVNGRYTDNYYTELDNYESIGGYFLGNAQVELKLQNGLSLAGWVRNFTNVRYAATLYVAPPVYAPYRGAPRTFGGTIGFQF